MKNNSILGHLYLGLWSLYWLQGTLFPSGGYMSQGILAILLLVSIYYFFISHFKYQLPPVMKTMTLMVVLFMVYGLFAIISGQTYYISENGLTVKAYGYLKNVLISFLPVYTVYVETRQGHLTEKSMRIWTLIFLAVAIIGFYRRQSDSLAQLALAGSMRDEVVNNSTYSVLALMVLIPLFKQRPFVQYVLFAACMFFILIGLKRGAIVCGSAAMLWFLFNYRRGTKKGVGVFLLTAAVVVAALYAVSYMLETSAFFNQRLEATLAGSSGHRDEIYRILFNHFIYETSILQFLFGNGANATLKIAMNYAHNDWLEMAIDQGLFMVIVYAVYWFRMYKTIRRSRGDDTVYLMLSLFFVIYFIKTFFSMSYSELPTWASAGLGFALANYSVENETNH